MDLQAQAEAFRNQEEFEDVPVEWDQLRGMRTKSYNMPVFTYMNDYHMSCLYEDELIRLYLNQALPYPELYPEMPDRAGMSFVHVLAVPKERIYNACALRPGDAGLVEHMMDTFDYYINCEDYRNELLVELTRRCVPQLETTHLRNTFTESVSLVRDKRWDSIGYYFHLHPNHSVGHLHMHCLLHGPGLTTEVFHNLSYKNTPARVVLNGLKSNDANKLDGDNHDQD